MLGDGAGIDLQDVHVVVVAGDHHIVPLVVVERLVGVPLHQRRPVAQVEHIMDVSAKTRGVSRRSVIKTSSRETTTHITDIFTVV